MYPSVREFTSTTIAYNEFESPCLWQQGRSCCSYPNRFESCFCSMLVLENERDDTLIA